jgi:hypothetical protein
MLVSEIQSLAITARMAAIVGSDTFDRLFAGVEFNEVDGDILFVYAQSEDCADEMEDEFALISPSSRRKSWSGTSAL